MHLTLLIQHSRVKLLPLLLSPSWGSEILKVVHWLKGIIFRSLIGKPHGRILSLFLLVSNFGVIYTFPVRLVGSWVEVAPSFVKLTDPVMRHHQRLWVLVVTVNALLGSFAFVNVIYFR